MARQKKRRSTEQEKTILDYTNFEFIFIDSKRKNKKSEKDESELGYMPVFVKNYEL